MCEKSLCSLGNYVAHHCAQSSIEPPAFIKLLQQTPSGRNYRHSWYGLLSIIDVPGALQLYSTAVRLQLQLPMIMLPHTTVGSACPNYEGVVAALMQLGNGGSDLSGISISSYSTKAKNGKKQPSAAFPSSELQNNTTILLELVKVRSSLTSISTLMDNRRYCNMYTIIFRMKEANRKLSCLVLQCVLMVLRDCHQSFWLKKKHLYAAR